VKVIVKGSLAGGLVLWFWSFFYWAVSGIPIGPVKTFRDEGAVMAVLKEQAPEPGYYALPTPHQPGDVSGDAQTRWVERRMAQVAGGPFVAATVRPDGVGGIGSQVGRAFTGYVAAAGLATVLVMQTVALGFFRRAAFVFSLGLLAWVVSTWPMVVWWGLPVEFALVILGEFVVGWGVAGLVISGVVGDR
jgi:hypothetical protein